MNRVCVVTNEIYPLDRGGIARLAYNFATENLRRGAPAELHFLLPASVRPKARQVETEFHGVATIHYCGESLRSLGPLGKLVQQFGPKDSIDFHMVEALRYLAGLLDAQRNLGREFDIVEFPDFGGWASAAIAAKRAGIALRNTLISVRLHSSLGLIVDHEPFMHEASDWMAAICDLERQSLLGADLIIAHLRSTAEMNRGHFGFGDQWMGRVRIEMPPITLTELETADPDEAALSGKMDANVGDFLFSSRLQPFKRPDLFVRAAVHYLDRHGDGGSVFRVASYGWNGDYIDWLKRLVPPRWQRRIVFLDNLAPQARARLLRQSILVIPSIFESLCLLAYEARQLGVKLILNRHCCAFGAESELWRDGADCLFFDGDFVSLAETMHRALVWKPRSARPLTLDAPYWETSTGELCSRAEAPARPLTLSYLLYGIADLELLGRRIGELQRSFGLSQIHVLAPKDAFDSAGIPLAIWQVRGVAVHPTGWHEPTPSELQSVICELQGDAVAFLPFDMDVEQGFWTMAAECLASEPEASVFTSHLEHHESEDARAFTLNYGQAPTVALLADRIAHRASVIRRDVLMEFGLREEAGERWHEDLCLRLVVAGRSVIVAPALLATQSGKRRQSRIASSRFFATHRDEAGRRFGAPYRQGSASVAYNDSVESIDHAGWIARQEETAPRLAASEQPDSVALQFRNVVLKNSTPGDDASYAELEIALEGVNVGRVPIDWLAFKILRFMGEAQLEFRDGGNSRQFFREWPPPTSDRWGALAVWSTSPAPNPNRIFFEKARKHDSQRLRLLLESLPEIVRSLPLSERERAQWLRVARALQQPA